MGKLEELTQEAPKRGIVPGAVIRCCYSPNDIGVVMSEEKWEAYNDGSLRVAKCGDRWVYAVHPLRREWAEVVFPAPEIHSSDVLESGVGCRCSLEAQVYIHNTARSMGIPTETYSTICPSLRMSQSGLIWTTKAKLLYCSEWIPLHEFIRRLQNMKVKKKELTLEVAKGLLKQWSSHLVVSQEMASTKEETEQYDLD